MLSKLKNIVRRILNGSIFYRIQCKIQHEWMGTHYGGFYINPDRLNEKSVVYSIGIGEDISFDSDLINKFGCTVFGFDPTPKSINWVESQEMPKQFKFSPFGISDTNGTMSFYLPKNKGHISGSLILDNNNVDNESKITVPVKTITSVMAQYNHDRIDLLKMDIEGSEYAVIDDILKNDIRINQLIVEFHARMFKDGIKCTNQAIKKLNKAGYKIFAMSESGEEISFIFMNNS